MSLHVRFVQDEDAMNEATFKEIEKQREQRFGKRETDDPEVAKFFKEIDEDNERQEREKKAACEFACF